MKTTQINIDDLILRITVEKMYQDALLKSYLKHFYIPVYNANNPLHKLIQNDFDLSELNNDKYRHFFIKPGIYKNFAITNSGSEIEPKTLCLLTNNELHPGQMDEPWQAQLSLTFESGVHDWIIDRISVLKSGSWTTALTIKKDTRNILVNRAHIKEYFMGINVHGSLHKDNCTRNITIQNSRLERMTDAGIDNDRAAIMLLGEPWNAANTVIENCRIVNNEIVNANDGIMPLRDDYGSGKLANFPGLKILFNDISVNEEIYTNGQGIKDVNGLFSMSENGIDIKAGSDEIDNPVYIAHNHIWGFRKTDTKIGGSGSSGEGMVIHYNTKNCVLKHNVIFDCERILSIQDSGGVIDPFYPDESPLSARNLKIANNIFSGQLSSYSLTFWDSKNIEFIDNVMNCNGKAWAVFNGSEENLTIKDNILLNFKPAIFRNAVNKTVLIDNIENFTGKLNDYSFTTDKFTNNPKIKTISKILLESWK